MRLLPLAIAGKCFVTCLAATAPVHAQDCAIDISKATRPWIEVALRSIDVCRNLPGKPRTKALALPVFRGCLTPQALSATGRLDVTCAADEGALFKSEASERIRFRFDFAIAECRFTRVEVRPSGALGQSVANVMNLERRLERNLEKRIAAFCR